MPIKNFDSTIDLRSDLDPVVYHRLKMCIRSLYNNFLWICLIPLAWFLTQHFAIAINLSRSLPQKVWLVQLNKRPERGDYLLFKAPSHLGLDPKTTLIKQVKGLPGDRVQNLERHIYINGDYVCYAKQYSLTGQVLSEGFEGRLETGEYYVHSPHPNSLDSRYAAMGLIYDHQHIGVAYALW